MSDASYPDDTPDVPEWLALAQPEQLVAALHQRIDALRNSGNTDGSLYGCLIAWTEPHPLSPGNAKLRSAISGDSHMLVAAMCSFFEQFSEASGLDLPTLVSVVAEELRSRNTEHPKNDDDDEESDDE